MWLLYFLSKIKKRTDRHRRESADRTGHFHFSFLFGHADMLPAAFAGKNAVLFSHGIAFLLQADKLQIFLILSLACHHISRKHAEQRIDNTAKRHKIQNRADGFQRQDIQDDGKNV